MDTFSISSTKDVIETAFSIDNDGYRNYKLYIHISDVAGLIEEGMPIDIEAERRKESKMLIVREPMMPSKLTTHQFNLIENTKRLGMTLEFEVTQEGIIDYSTVKYYNSIIKNKRAMSEKEVNDMLDKAQDTKSLKSKQDDYLGILQLIREITENRRKLRE